VEGGSDKGGKKRRKSAPHFYHDADQDSRTLSRNWEKYTAIKSITILLGKAKSVALKVEGKKK
jgi:hypothetical protein